MVNCKTGFWLLWSIAMLSSIVYVSYNNHQVRRFEIACAPPWKETLEICQLEVSKDTHQDYRLSVEQWLAAGKPVLQCQNERIEAAREKHFHQLGETYSIGLCEKLGFKNDGSRRSLIDWFLVMVLGLLPILLLFYGRTVIHGIFHVLQPARNFVSKYRSVLMGLTLILGGAIIGSSLIYESKGEWWNVAAWIGTILSVGSGMFVIILQLCKNRSL